MNRNTFMKTHLPWATKASEATGIQVCVLMIAAIKSCNAGETAEYKTYNTCFLLPPGDDWKGPTFTKKLLGKREGCFAWRIKPFRDYNGDWEQNFMDFATWLKDKCPELVGATDMKTITKGLAKANIPPREYISAHEYKILFRNLLPNLIKNGILPPQEG